ncbi:MAG: amylo-alpha-1,6-glucosidase [Synergistaceae bacterium]|nr:amylo-alpha-1,6-glucosidase [Synergistaceae bacterium]
MYLGKADVNTYDKGAGREFLVSNGLGSYGFSTVIGANTRREHGLLVTRPKEETQHSVLISKIEETISYQNKKYQLSTNRYKDLVYPDGYRYLQEYQGNPFPSMLFIIHSILLKKSIFMPHGKACTVLKYELLASPDKVKLDLRPLFAHRLNNEVSGDDKNKFIATNLNATSLAVEGRGLKSFCSVSSGEWSIKPLWFENIFYKQDDNVDSLSVDKLWSPGSLVKEISEGDVIYVVLSTEPSSYSMEDLIAMEKETADRFENILEQANLPALSSAEQDMIFASYHLVDDRLDSTSSIYSGYPSVKTRARDTFISLPGLTLATGRESVAVRTLNLWIERARDNDWIMPEFISLDGKPIFEGMDDGLWFVYAADKYLTHIKDTKNTEPVEPVTDAVKSIVDKYLCGIPELDTVYSENGLLCLKKTDSPRQWMHGVINGEEIVTRTGYLVEVNALWFNALKVAEKYADESQKEKYASAAKLCAKTFKDVFWCSEINGLYDFVDPEVQKQDTSIRPNQILAISLPYSPLNDKELSIKVLRLCWDELYTTYGLRTLAPHHDKFKGRSEGRLDQRQKARFRGMAWTWLLGHFITAYLKYNPSRKDLGWIFMRPFNSHIRHGCLGGVAEFFDGIMPYRPQGDVLSANALGELLRVLYEDLGPED